MIYANLIVQGSKENVDYRVFPDCAIPLKGDIIVVDETRYMVMRREFKLGREVDIIVQEASGLE